MRKIASHLDDHVTQFLQWRSTDHAASGIVWNDRTQLKSSHVTVPVWGDCILNFGCSLSWENHGEDVFPFDLIFMFQYCSTALLENFLHLICTYWVFSVSFLIRTAGFMDPVCVTSLVFNGPCYVEHGRGIFTEHRFGIGAAAYNAGRIVVSCISPPCSPSLSGMNYVAASLSQSDGSKSSGSQHREILQPQSRSRQITSGFRKCDHWAVTSGHALIHKIKKSFIILNPTYYRCWERIGFFRLGSEIS